MTLLEITLALAIAGLALLGCIMLLEQIEHSASLIGREQQRDAASGNGARLLHRLLSDAHPAADSVLRFRGDRHNAAFTSMCDVPSGWPEACHVALMIDSLRDSTAVVADMDAQGRYEVRRLAGAVTFAYLDLTSKPPAWVSVWAPSIGLPGAIALVGASDTIVLPLGAARE